MTQELFTEVYVGDQDDAESGGAEFDHVLTLNQTHNHPDDWRPPGEFVPLVDGQNDQAEFDRAVDIAVRLLQARGSTLIHCNSGVSRSPTVVATAVAAIEDEPFEAIMAEIRQMRKATIPHPALVRHAQSYLDIDE